MSHNTFGHLFRVTTWGESHGPAIGCVVDGCPPRIPLDRGRHPALARPPPPRPVPLHHAAAGARPGPHPVRRVRGPDHRHADRAADRERRPAVEGLRRHRRALPPRPRRPDLRAEIRHPRLSRRRPVLGARDRDARRRRRGGAQGAGDHCGRSGVRIRGALVQIGPHRIDRARWDWDAVEPEPVLLPRPGRRRRVGGLPRRGAQGAARRSARSSRWWPTACRPAWARRSTASSTPTSPRR